MAQMGASLTNPTTVCTAAIGAIAVAYFCYWLFFSATKTSSFLPIHAPLEIALATYLAQAGGLGRRIYSICRRYNGSLFGISKRHQVIIDLPNADRFMSQGPHTLEHLPTQLTLMCRVFGSENSAEYLHACHATIEPLLQAVQREFLGENASTAALERGQVSRKMSSLVTFQDDEKDMQVWERAADVKVIQLASPPESGAVEANLMALVRDFGATVAIPVLYGKDFLQRNPDLLQDFWRFDNDLFPLLMIGVPSWAPFKMVREGMQARKRLIAAMEGLYRRIDQYQNGEPVDFDADMSDVGMATERNKIYAKHNVSFKHRADMDFPFLWGQNGNTQPLLFWYIIYTYSTPGMVERFRGEMAPYVKLSSEKGPVEIEAVNIAALNRECPLMKAALFETFRLGTESTSIRRIAKPLVIPDGDYKHHLQPGSFVSMPWGATHSDPILYPEPEKFVPERFLEVDGETGKQVPRYKALRPWSVGAGSCKGRTFAEKEILTIAACLISIWDIEPCGGKWQIPAMIPGTGAKRPVSDVRVILRRRIQT